MRSGMTLTALCGGLVLLGTVRGEEAKPARKSIYDATADARAQVEKATAQAKRDGTRVLLMFGGDWCGWCHKLHALFQENKEIATILYNEYELVMIDTKAPNADVILEKASQGQDGMGYPFLAVYDADGKLLKGQRTGPLEEGDHHDPAKVKAFLDEWKVPAKDAEVVVSEALAKASSEGKRVFLRFGAPWCGWCHKLDDYLARPEVAKALADAFVLAKVDVDRMTHGPEVMKKYRPEASGGIPWFVVLDGKGQAHGNADAEFGNMGYPFEPREIDAFIKLMEFQETLDRGQLDTLRKSLESAADEIKAQQAKRKAAG